MAKPNQSGRYDQKKADPSKDQDQEKEEEGAEKEGPEAEQNKAQNTVGNSALAAQMINSGATDGGGDGGGGGGLSMRKAAQDEEKDYGGDGVADNDVPLTLEDLTRSWNPGTHKTQDRPSWLEPMPSDELPPEDASFLAAVRAATVARSDRGARSETGIDRLIQPSSTVVAASLLDWTRGVNRLAGVDLLQRAIGRVLVPPAPFLHDPSGRVLFARARAGAIGTWLLVRSRALSADPSTATIACVSFLLELEGHRRHQEAVRIKPGVEGKQMPRTTEVFQIAYAARSGPLTPRELSPSANARVRALLTELLDLEDPDVYVPALIPDEGADPDDHDDLDPLGLDDVIAELTGGKVDGEGPLFYSAIQAAEKLAAATARARVHVASTAVALAQVAGLWSAGAPVDALMHVADVIDQQSDKNLRLLVEIARAAQKRAVPPKGLKAGLKRASRALLQVHEVAASMLAEVIGGILPGQAELPPVERAMLDPLEDAWLDGNPSHALPWLTDLPPSPERDATVLLVRLAARGRAEEFGPALLEVASRMQDEALREVLRIAAGPCLLAARDHAGALELCRAQMASGVRRRNGLVLADGALLGMEALRQAGRDDEAASLRLEAGRAAWTIGAPAALTLLARWTPPVESDADA